MHPLSGHLNEVQIIGYGQTTKRNNTGSVSTINSTAIDQQPVTNPLAAMQGRAPGVFVQTQNGLPGGNIKIQIRGQGSIASGTDPLYVIDGVPYISAPVYTGVANGANGTISPFSVINPSDIERIDILKDADATAIYGSRGANGVVLITTKKGISGKDDFNISFSQGVSRIYRLNDYLNLEQYLQMRRQAFANDHVTPTISNAPDLLVWDTTKSTNWQKYFLGGTANSTNIQGSLSGGDLHNHYLASLNYHQEGTILPGNESYQKGGGFVNFDHSSIDRKLQTSFSVAYDKDNNKTLYSATTAVSLPPDFPVYNPDGSFNWTISNPVAGLQKTQNSQSGYLNANTTLKYLLFKGFDAGISMGYNNYTLSETALVPVIAQNPANSPLALAYFANNSSERYLIEPQFNYSTLIAGGTLKALLGGTYQNVVNQGTGLTASDVSNPDLLGNIGAAGTITAKSNTYSKYLFGSVFGRVGYTFKDRYLLDVNLRRDGSSRFGPGKQFGNFYAIGAGWIFSEEQFMRDNLPFLSFGKLRSSYGLTGNDQISDYQYLSTYSSGSTYGGIATLTPSRIANPEYSWETTHKFEVALELGFWDNRISATAAWFKHSSSNQLLSYTIPYTTGFSSYQANFPAVVENTGLELEVNADVIKKQSFHWTITGNITIPKNKLASFPNIATSSYANTYIVGQDLSVVKSYSFIGVDPNTGLAMFRTNNSNGIPSFPADIVVAGKTSPDLYGGFGNNLSYKNFSLDLFFEFTKRSYPAYTPVLGSSIANDPEFVTSRWQQPGDISNIPRATLNSSNLSNYYLSQFGDASYIRLKNVSLSYNLKSSLFKRLPFKALNVSINGENVWLLANKDRFDPEISNASAAFPPLETWTVGIKITL